ncbi:hypothetical protein BHM03_00032892 [Ensete ventricosum]|nr:hypothetical protein BHM03_00032892 [Ensete ventricosum]
MVDFDDRRSLSGGISQGRKKKREKESENLEIRCCSPDPDPLLTSFSSRLHGEISSPRMGRMQRHSMDSSNESWFDSSSHPSDVSSLRSLSNIRWKHTRMSDLHEDNDLGNGSTIESNQLRPSGIQLRSLGSIDRPLPGGTAKIDHWRSISAVGSRFRPSAVEAAGFDRRRSIEGEINRRWSIEGEKGKNKKRRRRKKKMIHTSFPRAILDRTPSPSSPIGDSSPSREDGMSPHARRKIEATRSRILIHNKQRSNSVMESTFNEVVLCLEPP